MEELPLNTAIISLRCQQAAQLNGQASFIMRSLVTAFSETEQFISHS